MNKGLIIFYILGIVSVVTISLITYSVCIRKKLAQFTPVKWFFALFSSYMIFAQYLKYLSLHFYGDFAHWAQAIYNISTAGKPLCVTLAVLRPGTFNYFSVHFTPLLYILAIPYKFWPYNETIICLNVLIMLSSAIPLYKLALTCHHDKRFALFIAVLLLWYPTFQYIVLYEFEMLRFSIPIILWMLYFWEKKKMAGYYFFLLMAVLVREEVGLTIMMFGLYLIFFEKQRRTGLISALIGLMAFVVITQMIMPALRAGDMYQHIAMKSFAAFGNTFSEILINIFAKPVLVMKTIVQPIKLANVFMFFLPLLFIPFLAPAVLIATLANFGVGLLSTSTTHISYMLFYLSPSIPFIFYAFIRGWPRLLTWLNIRTNKRFMGRTVNLSSAAMAAVFSGLLVSNVFFGPSPISLQFWFKNLRPAPFRTQDFHYSVYKVTDHHRKAEKISEMIPDTAIVSAHRFLQPRLYNKGGIVLLGDHEGLDGQFKADYVFFDKTNNGLKQVSPAYRTQSDFDVFKNDKKSWKLIKSEDGFFLYKRITE